MKRDKYARSIPTETFQPSQQNSKRLQPLRKKRGARTKLINAALDLYYKQGAAV